MRDSEQRRIGDKAVTKFKDRLYSSSELSLAFNTQSENDFGIDLEAHWFINENHTGHLLHFQVKGRKGSLKRNKKGEKFFDLENSEYKNYLEKVLKYPVFLVVVENVFTEKPNIYCIPLRLEQNELKVRIRVHQKYKLTNSKKSLERVLQHFKESKSILSKSEFLTL
jgi:hypothetical protein